MKTSLTKGSIYITASQIIFLVSSYAAQFILGTFLGPSMYGIYGVVIALVTTVSLFLVSGLPESVSKYIAEDQSRAHGIKKKALKIQTALSLLIFAAYFLSAGFIANLLNDPGLKIYIQISAFLIPGRAISSIYSGFFNGTYRFKEQATAQIIFALSRLFFILVLVYFFSLKGAVIGFISAPFFSWLYSAIKSGDKKARVIRFGIARLVRFAVPILIFSLLLTLLISLDLFLVKRILGDNEQVGYYNAAAVISKLPYLLFGAIAIVSFPAISNAVTNKLIEKSKRLINQSVRYLLILLFPTIILISATSKRLITFVYTESYAPAAAPLSILIIGLGFLTVFYLMAKVLIAAGKPYIPMIALFVLTIFDFTLNWVLISVIGIKGAAIATTTTAFLAMAVLLFFVYSRFRTIVTWNSLAKNVVAGMVILFIALNMDVSRYMLLIEYILLFTIYIGLLIILKEIGRGDLKRFNWLFRRFGIRVF